MRKAVLHVTDCACRRRKAIRVTGTSVSGSDIVCDRKGVQERVRVDRLAATAGECLRVCLLFSGRSARISAVVTPSTHRVYKEVCGGKRYGRQSHGSSYVGRRSLRRGRSGGRRGGRRGRGGHLVRGVPRVRIMLVRTRHVGSASVSSPCVPSRSEPASEPMMSRRCRSFPFALANKQRR